MGQMIEFKRPDGKTAPGYFTAPAKDAGSAPGIVIIQEWWGVTKDIMEIADRYASLGYRALIPDLFRGRTAVVPDEANHLVEGLDFQDAYSQDVRGALAHLKQNSKKAAVTGYCVGGALALLAVMHLTEPDAAAIWYGAPPAEAGDPATIKVPVILHYAQRDSYVTPAVAARVEERLKAGNVKYEMCHYDAEHGFCNPNPMGSSGLGHYNAEAAKLSWDRTAKFLEGVLR